ncbi:MAG TPA: hypothetical protein VEW69_01765 [Alphaproteobacteria bacterium]|nr:hypothetical protein [Alphaproteobacteria bacterium]
MRKYWFAVIVAAVLCTVLQAQENTQSQVAASSPVIAATANENALTADILKGTGIVAELSSSLKANKLKSGDKIKAEVTQDVLLHGKTVIPVGSKLIGHITEAKKRTDADPESRLGFVFDKIRMKGHRELDLQAVVQAMAPPAPRESLVDKPDMMLPPSMMMGTSNSSGAQPIGGRQSTGRGASNNTPAVTTPARADVAVLSANVTTTQSPVQMASPTMMSNKPLGNGSRGIFGLPGLALRQGTQGPLVVSRAREVKLEYGTQIILLVAGSAR